MNLYRADLVLNYLRQQLRNGVQETPQPVFLDWAEREFEGVSRRYLDKLLHKLDGDRKIVRRRGTHNQRFAYLLSLPGVVAAPRGIMRKRKIFSGLGVKDCAISIDNVAVTIPGKWVVPVFKQIEEHLRNSHGRRDPKGSVGPVPTDRDQAHQDGRADGGRYEQGRFLDHVQQGAQRDGD